MFSNRTLGTKIGFGFGLLLVFLVAITYVGYTGMAEIAMRVEKADDMNRLIKQMLETRRHEKNFILRGDEEYITRVHDLIQELRKQADDSKARFRNPANRESMEKVLSAIDLYADKFDTYVSLEISKRELAQQMEKFMVDLGEKTLAITKDERKEWERLDEAFTKRLHTLTEGTPNDSPVKQQLRELEQDSSRQLAERSRTAGAVIKINAMVADIRTRTLTLIQQADEARAVDTKRLLQQLEQSAMELERGLDGAEGRKNAASLIDLVTRTRTAYAAYSTALEKQREADATMVIAGRSVQAHCAEARASQKTQMMDTMIRDNTLMICGSLIALLAGALLAFFITRGVNRQLRNVIEGLTEASEQVAAASGQVAAASQDLADGASQQAAAVEETSASLEQMSAMTRQNADNAAQAHRIMTETGQIVKNADSSMQDLTHSMERISEIGEEIRKIVRTIDEIAFQTNLLSLNAAVEAARAGEAGAGFAVVADEVRNLALRSAESARHTAALIDDSVERITRGAELAQRTNSDFRALVTNAGKASELVGEIAVASQEQAQGIEQVTRAVDDIDRVTQKNAATAEESAASSEQMNAQTLHVRDLAGQLLAMVVGNDNSRESAYTDDQYPPSYGESTVDYLDAPTTKWNPAPTRETALQSGNAQFD